MGYLGWNHGGNMEVATLRTRRTRHEPKAARLSGGGAMQA